MTSLAEPTEAGAPGATRPLVYHAHPAALPPGARLAALRAPAEGVPVWDPAARWLKLPPALDHAVRLPEPPPAPEATATPAADPAIEAEPVPAAEPIVALEPIAAPEPVATPDPVAVLETVAAPEPIAVAAPVAAPEPVAVLPPATLTPEAAVEPIHTSAPPAVVEPVAVITPAPVSEQAQPALAAEPVARVDVVPSPRAAPALLVPAAPSRAPRRLLWPALGGLVLVVGVAAVIAAWPTAKPAVTIAVSFKTPVMVLRASRSGSIASVAVKPGDPVAPTSVLLTLDVPPPPDPIAIVAAERVQVAQRRAAAISDSLQQPLPPTPAGRARLADLNHQRDLAAAELAAAQDALARLPAPDPAEMPIVAGVHGVVLSVEAVAGADATAGTPLIRMADCDHGYVSLDSVSTVNPGSLVEVRLPNQPPVPATVRPGSRLAGPGTALSEIAEPAPGAFAKSCPLGATGVASPIPAAR